MALNNMPINLSILLAAYLIGSVSGSLLLGRLRGVDIREHGSGNAGGTNAFRTQGAKFALGVVLIDVGKGIVAAYLASKFTPIGSADWLPFATVLCAVVGHVWPIFHRFRGGKGAATLVGGLAVVWPMALWPLIIIWLLCLILTGYVGLSTILAALSLCAYAYWQQAGIVLWAFAVLSAWLILFTHRANLQRLLQGKEHRFEKAMLLRRLFSPANSK
jgi:acyl phosphate:glycerol-3-phosphate acyltransferase